MNQILRRSIFLAVAFLCFGYFISGCSMFGPDNVPDFSRMNWSKLEISYWVLEKPSGPRVKRRFSCGDKNIISSLHSAMLIKEVRPNSLGKDERFVITLDDGEIWDCGFVFENRFDMCRRSDNYSSYILTLSNTDFFYQITALCLNNEKKMYPDAIKQNIILRTNRTNESYQVLNIRN